MYEYFGRIPFQMSEKSPLNGQFITSTLYDLLKVSLSGLTPLNRGAALKQYTPVLNEEGSKDQT